MVGGSLELYHLLLKINITNIHGLYYESELGVMKDFPLEISLVDLCQLWRTRTPSWGFLEYFWKVSLALEV